MDGYRFDTWMRTRAIAANRRALLGWSLTGGLAAALARHRPAMAQFDGGGSCTYAVTLTSSLAGGAIVSGTLVIDIGDGGAIDTGSLTLAGQNGASVVGQTTGLAIDLLISLEDGSALSLTGVSHATIANCSNPIFGSLANASSDQLGTWAAQPGGTATQTGSSAQPAPPPAAPTPTPLPGVCEAPKMICGAACCPAGSFCLDTLAGSCECPAGTEECGIACFPGCADGTPLDPTTCLCPTG